MITRLYELAVKENDYPSQFMLQWFINEQVEEEQNGTTIVEMLRMVGSQPQGLFMVDSKLGAARQGLGCPSCFSDRAGFALRSF